MYSLDDQRNLFVGLIIIEMLPNWNEKYTFSFYKYFIICLLYFRFRNRANKLLTCSLTGNILFTWSSEKKIVSASYEISKFISSDL
jgi:hypothetical protein